MAEVGWTLPHLEDLDADFLRFYRLEWAHLGGPRFFSLADRVGAYGGMISYRIAEEEREAIEEPVALVDLANDPDMADLIEVG